MWRPFPPSETRGRRAMP